jgi:pyruvate ferredoxin oxidoreductase alpha subunit
VDAFIPPFRPPATWVLDPGVPRAYSGLPEPKVYDAFQRNVAKAMDAARPLIETVASEFGSHFGRSKIGALDVAGDPHAETALVTIGTIGDSAFELLDDGEDLLLVRVHAYRPFPSRELVSVLSHARHICVVDRAAAFGSFGPLGADVRALGLAHADAVTNVICGVGGTEVTPTTLRWSIDETRSGNATDVVLEPVYVPEVF